VVSIVIMAGGRGERFWPKSVRSRPKQFHRIVSGRTMIQETFFRVYPEVKKENIHVVAGREFRSLILNQLPDLPEENLILEPEGKNTAAAIGLAAVELTKKDPGCSMIVLTADHVVEPKNEFLRAIQTAARIAKDGYLVTFGIPPDRPATEYGYIETGAPIPGEFGLPVLGVKMFKEKPSFERAVEYIERGNYLWNSGMFAFRVENILRALEKHLPSLHRALMRISKNIGTDMEEPVKQAEFQKLESISIDYGVMENADNIACVRPHFAWDDVGSWGALFRHRKADSEGNILPGNTVVIDSKNNIVMGEEGFLVSLVGVSDLIVVKDETRLLVCNRNQDQRVKEVVQELSKNKKYEPYL
jgi:mannose-1-phosphate guanylyltransferase